MVSRRKNRLIKPRLQLKLILSFTATALVALLAQTSLIFGTLTKPVTTDGQRVLSSETLDSLWNIALVTGALLVPASIVIGALVTKRIAGPLHRFEQYLEDVVAGEAKGPCEIRADDELQELCQLINRVTKDARTASLSLVEREETQEERTAA